MDEALLRTLTPTVIGILVRRGADFAAAEDAVQDALVEAVRVWPDDPPRDPRGWLVTVAWRKFLDAARADTARRHREVRVEGAPRPGPGEVADDTLQLYFLCAHPSLTPASAVALTLRAVGGLTTRQIAQAYLVPEATMAQRISRAKRTVSGVRLNQPGDVATVLRVLYLVFNEGYSGDVDLAAEAIRLTRQLAAMINHEEVAGLLALMLLHHARRPARTGPATPPQLPTCTSVTVTPSPRPGSTPKPPGPRPTSPNATTSRAKPPASTRSCAAEPSRKPDSGHTGTISITLPVHRTSRNAM